MELVGDDTFNSQVGGLLWVVSVDDIYIQHTYARYDPTTITIGPLMPRTLTTQGSVEVARTFLHAQGRQRREASMLDAGVVWMDGCRYAGVVSCGYMFIYMHNRPTSRRPPSISISIAHMLIAALSPPPPHYLNLQQQQHTAPHNPPPHTQPLVTPALALRLGLLLALLLWAAIDLFLLPVPAADGGGGVGGLRGLARDPAFKVREMWGEMGGACMGICMHACM